MARIQPQGHPASFPSRPRTFESIFNEIRGKSRSKGIHLGEMFAEQRFCNKGQSVNGVECEISLRAIFPQCKTAVLRSINLLQVPLQYLSLNTAYQGQAKLLSQNPDDSNKAVQAREVQTFLH